MLTEKIIRYIIILAGVAIALFLFPFALNLFSPFIAAFIAATIFQRLVKFLEEKFKISRGISSALIVTVIVALIAVLLVLVLFQIFSQAKNLILALPSAIDSLKLRFEELSNKYNGYKLSLPPEVSSIIDSLLTQLSERSKNISVSITNIALSAAKSFASILPKILLFLAMFILGTVFFTKDYRLIINFLHELFPPKITAFFAKVKKILTHAFSSYMKAQLILMAMTAILVTVSFWIVGIKYSLIWGIVCGLVDILPFLGTAIIIVPLALLSLAYNDLYTFIALLIIQALIFVVRQLAEPRVVSKQIGIHPILTLISVYIGLKYFGFIGVVLAPIITLLIVNLYVSYKENKS